MLKPSAINSGYRKVALSGSGRRWQPTVHSLVLTAFVGPRPSGHYGCHRNGIKTDNRLENLAWQTPLENSADSRRHGRLAVGERNGRAVLTAELVRQLRVDLEWMPVRQASRKYGVSEGAVAPIEKRRTWRTA